MKMFRKLSESCHLPEELRTRWQAILVLSFALLVSGSARGETVTIPTGAESRENPTGNPYPLASGNNRSQQTYAPSLFPTLLTGQAFRLDGIAFRLDSRGIDGGGASADFDRIEILISSSPGGFTLNLEQNHGANLTRVFDQSIFLSGIVPPGSTPSSFDIKIPFTTPFDYNPSTGSLVVEIRNHSSDILSGLGAAEIAGSSFFYGNLSGTFTQSAIQDLETQFSYQIVPEPSVGAIALLGIFLLAVNRKNRQ